MCCSASKSVPYISLIKYDYPTLDVRITSSVSDTGVVLCSHTRCCMLNAQPCYADVFIVQYRHVFSTVEITRLAGQLSRHSRIIMLRANLVDTVHCRHVATCLHKLCTRGHHQRAMLHTLQCLPRGTIVCMVTLLGRLCTMALLRHSKICAG